MNVIVDGLNWIGGLGPMVMMPIIIFILGLVFRVKLPILVKSSLMVGIGFAGVNVVINWFVSQVGPAVQAMVTHWGLQTDIMDVGWPARAAATWSFPLAAVVVFAIILLNIVMLLLKWTRVVMVDFWSYNHFILTGAVIWYITNNAILAVIASVIDAAITFKLSDWTAPLTEEFFGLEGVVFPTSNSVGWAPLAYLLNKIYDRIPGFNKLDAKPEGIQKRFGFVGEPMFMGLIIGIAIGLLAKETAGNILILGMSTAATMVLTPKMMQILMEGLMPFSNEVKNMLNRRFPGNNYMIGVDAALTVANSSAIACGIIMVPITLVLAAVLPGNRLLPISDIAYLAMWLSAWPVAFGKGNILRGIVSTTIITACVLLISTNLAPIHTDLAVSGGFTLPEGVEYISTEDAGTHIITFVLSKIFEVFGG